MYATRSTKRTKKSKCFKKCAIKQQIIALQAVKYSNKVKYRIHVNEYKNLNLPT